MNSNNNDKDKQKVELEDEKEEIKDKESNISYEVKLDNYFLLFSYFRIVLNEEYYAFKQKNSDKWGVISYLIDYLQKLFKKLNLIKAEIDTSKLLVLAADELRTISKADLINCLSDKDILEKGFDKASKLFASVKDSACITIQKFVRCFLAKIKYSLEKSRIKKVSKIQRVYRLYRLILLSKSLIGEKNEQNLEQWQKMMYNFQESGEK